MKILDIFKSKTKATEQKRLEAAQLLAGRNTFFTNFTGSAYENDIYRTAVDAIAKNAAKLKPQHVVYSNETGERYAGDSRLNHLLETRPNDQITTYDLLYKLVTHYYTNNNAFAFLEKDGRQLKAIYPVEIKNIEFLHDESGALYCNVLLPAGQRYILPYNEVIILRRFFNSNELLGDSNDAIQNSIQLAHTQNEGMQHAIRSGANIRGILKYNQVLSAERLKDEKERFVEDYLQVNNDGGIAALDAKYDYIPIDQKTEKIDGAQVEVVKEKIYSYLGINEKIVKAEYSENEWAAFYESTIEPLALQISLELTTKLFTEREQAFGNSIQLESNRLQFTSNETKMKMIKELMPYGIFTINQALEILNLPPVSDGNKRLQTLNVIDANKAEKYQQQKAGAKEFDLKDEIQDNNNRGREA